MGTDGFAIVRPVGYLPLTHGDTHMDLRTPLCIALILAVAAMPFVFDLDPNNVGWQSGPALGGD
jgi:hypothetical protein